MDVYIYTYINVIYIYIYIYNLIIKKFLLSNNNKPLSTDEGLWPKTPSFDKRIIG